MRPVVTLLAMLLTLGLLTACVPPDAGADAGRPAETGLEKLASGAECRIGPDGGPRVADRGIGGTGAPRRGQATSQVADRGIGGTGVVGVITGFASICVNGIEVEYDGTAAVDIDGTAAPTSALRVGQIVVIQAPGPKGAPHARTIVVRREIAGRIESVELGSGTLTIAGQPVSVPTGTWGANKFHLGDWVAVSGLRRADGTIVASRLDRAPADAFIARGQVVRDGAGVRVGSVALDGAAAASLSNGQFVSVTGRYVAGQPQARAVTLDTLFSNPAEFFGSSFNHLILQGFVHVTKGVVWLNGMKLNAAPGVHAHPGFDGVAIVSLERRPDGAYTTVDFRYTAYGSSAAGGAATGGPAAVAIHGAGGFAHGSSSLPPHGRPSAAAVPAQAQADKASSGPVAVGDAAALPASVAANSETYPIASSASSGVPSTAAGTDTGSLTLPALPSTSSVESQEANSHGTESHEPAATTGGGNTGSLVVPASPSTSSAASQEAESQGSGSQGLVATTANSSARLPAPPASSSTSAQESRPASSMPTSSGTGQVAVPPSKEPAPVQLKPPSTAGGVTTEAAPPEPVRMVAPPTSQMISGNTPSRNTPAVASAKPRSRSRRVARVSHVPNTVILSGSTSSPTVSLITGPATTVTTPAPAGSVVTKSAARAARTTRTSGTSFGKISGANGSRQNGQ